MMNNSEKKVVMAEMRMLRGISRMTRRDRIKNKVKSATINITSVSKEIIWSCFHMERRGGVKDNGQQEEKQTI